MPNAVQHRMMGHVTHSASGWTLSGAICAVSSNMCVPDRYVPRVPGVARRSWAQPRRKPSANREAKRQPYSWLLLAAVGIGCSGSTTQLDAATKGSIIQPTQPDAAFDFSGPDIIRYTELVNQGKVGPPRTFDAGCDQCPAFCDRDRCVNEGRGGGGYIGGMLGWECVERTSYCGGFVCMNHVCVSCRTDAECCPPPNDAGTSSCHASCQWLDGIGSNMCGP
jgi:hypothetical protein